MRSSTGDYEPVWDHHRGSVLASNAVRDHYDTDDMNRLCIQAHVGVVNACGLYFGVPTVEGKSE